MLYPCSCAHKTQDEFHGQGCRVHTVGGGKGRDNTRSLRCTVCSDEKKIQLKKEKKEVKS